MYDLWWSCSPSHPCTLWLWGCARTSAMGTCQSQILPAPRGNRAATYADIPAWVWNPVPARAGAIGGQWLGRACLPICGAAQVTCGQRGGNSYRSVVGFHGKWLPSSGWLPRARALAPVLWHGVRYGSQKFLPRRSRIQRQMASFKGLAAESKCLGLCPVAWGAKKGLRKAQVENSHRGVLGFHGKLLLSRG